MQVTPTQYIMWRFAGNNDKRASISSPLSSPPMWNPPARLKSAFVEHETGDEEVGVHVNDFPISCARLSWCTAVCSCVLSLLVTDEVRLPDVNLTVSEFSRVAVIGANGAGKSTG